MEDSRKLATVNGYQGLVAAIRARKDEMRISDTELEELAQLTRGHVSKLLAPGATKVLGPLSMGRLLRALGIELIVAENAEQTAKIRELYMQRNENQVRRRITLRAIATTDPPPWLIDKEKARQLRQIQLARTTHEQRSKAARKGALKRWRKWRVQKRKRLASEPDRIQAITSVGRGSRMA